MATALADPLLTKQGLVLSLASALYSSSSGRSTVHISLSAHTMARCSISFSVFVFATFRLSNGRTAERAAAQLDYMVEFFALSSTVTIWCVFHVDYAALVPHTGVERHSAFRSSAQPAAATRFHFPTLSVGSSSRCPHTDGGRHCALCLLHITLLQRTPPRNSPSQSFCSCVLPNTPSSARFSVFMNTSVKHRPTNSGNTMPATFSDAALPPRPPAKHHLTSGDIYADPFTQCRLR